MTRMAAARLAEIESATRYESGNRNPVVQAVYKELLAELREVTREREEARATVKRLQEAYLPGRWEKLREIEQERDKLKQELADLNNDAGNEYAMHYKGEMERLAAKVESLEEFYDTHVGDALEADDLRAENAKLKAVADAAKSIDWMDNAHDASIYIVTCKKADRLLAALASLDAKPGQEGA